MSSPENKKSRRSSQKLNLRLPQMPLHRQEIGELSPSLDRNVILQNESQFHFVDHTPSQELTEQQKNVIEKIYATYFG